jgi:hypothetical protein
MYTLPGTQYTICNMQYAVCYMLYVLYAIHIRACGQGSLLSYDIQHTTYGIRHTSVSYRVLSFMSPPVRCLGDGWRWTSAGSRSEGSLPSSSTAEGTMLFMLGTLEQVICNMKKRIGKGALFPSHRWTISSSASRMPRCCTGMLSISSTSYCSLTWKRTRSSGRYSMVKCA